MSVGSGESGQLVPGFERYTYTGRSAELDEPFQAIVSTLPGHADMIKLSGSRTDGLLDRVETEKNFHTLSLLSKWKNSRQAVECSKIGLLTGDGFNTFSSGYFNFYERFNQKASLLRPKDRLYDCANWFHLAHGCACGPDSKRKCGDRPWFEEAESRAPGPSD